MKRRSFLASLGTTTLLTSSMAGCLGSGPQSGANEFGYETLEHAGVEIPLVPVRDAIDWFREDEVVFADTRHPADYEELRIEGAVLSPSPDGLEPDDPIAAVSTETRIVTYCVCPHALAISRASRIIPDGYVHTYALDEGLQEWVRQGHPVEGTATE